MKLKAGVFFHNGLGDGINGLILAHNLHLNGWDVEIYQNTLGSMQNWVPHLPIFPYPPMEKLPEILEKYDRYFVVQNDSDPFVQALISEGKRRFAHKIHVIYLYPSRHIVKEPYYQDCLTDPEIPVAENMRQIVKEILHLPKISQGSGLIPPEGLIFRKYPKRVILHPTSARVSKNWPKEKYVKLALHLKEKGFTVVWIPGKKEGWEDVEAMGFEVPLFRNLDSLARYIYESGYFIGNDSGVGHLASALGLATMTFCRRKTLAKLWAPSFSKGVVLTPSSWIPNIRGFRLRDRQWQKFITLKMALRGFKKLVNSAE